MIVGAAEKPESVGQDLQRSFAEHQPIELHPFLEDFEDQVLLLDARQLGEVFTARLLDQLRHGHALQFGDVDIAVLDLLVAVVRIVAAQGHLFGDFFGQREGLGSGPIGLGEYR